MFADLKYKMLTVISSLTLYLRSANIQQNWWRHVWGLCYLVLLSCLVILSCYLVLLSCLGVVLARLLGVHKEGFKNVFDNMLTVISTLTNTFCWMFADLKYNLLEKKSSLISCVRKQIHFYVRGKEETHSEKSTTGFSENSTKCIREKGIKSKCKLLNKYILLNVRWSRGWFVLFWACLMCFWQLFCVGRSTAFCMFKCVVDTVSRIDSMIGLFCRI